MLTLKPTGQFKKDYKLAKKRGLDIPLLEAVIDTLLEEKPLDEKHHDHALTGNYSRHFFADIILQQHIICIA